MSVKASTAKRPRHGGSKTPEYRAWVNMRGRCQNPRHKFFANYGGRGITVSPEWESFPAFLADMGPRPSPEHSIERNNNDGNYEKGNCRWATRIEQSRNTRSNVFLTCNGETKCLSEWAHALRLEPHHVTSRIKHGWPLEIALTTKVGELPRRKYGKRKPKALAA